jgi:hypothetical protein
MEVQRWRFTGHASRPKSANLNTGTWPDTATTTLDEDDARYEWTDPKTRLRSGYID